MNGEKEGGGGKEGGKEGMKEGRGKEERRLVLSSESPLSSSCNRYMH